MAHPKIPRKPKEGEQISPQPIVDFKKKQEEWRDRRDKQEELPPHQEEDT